MATISAKFRRQMREIIGGRFEAQGFIYDEETTRINRYIFTYYRSINGINQRVTLGSRKMNWELVHGADVIGVIHYRRPQMLVTDTGGLPGELFWTKNKWFNIKLKPEDIQLETLLSYVDNTVFPSFEPIDTPEKYASIIPLEILRNPKPDLVFHEQYDFSPTQPMFNWFTRMVSINCFLGNLELAKLQAQEIIDHLLRKPGDRSPTALRIIAQAESVLELAPGDEVPLLSWQ